MEHDPVIADEEMNDNYPLVRKVNVDTKLINRDTPCHVFFTHAAVQYHNTSGWTQDVKNK